MGAFKIRGGLACFDQLAQTGTMPAQVMSATRGNHGQSIGWAARAHGVPCIIVVPFGNSVEKNAAMRALGATLIEHGADFQECREYAYALAAERGAHMVPSFHADSLAAGRVVESAVTTVLADGMACRRADQAALDILQGQIDHIVQVSDAEVAQAMRDVFAKVLQN